MTEQHLIKILGALLIHSSRKALNSQTNISLPKFDCNIETLDRINRALRSEYGLKLIQEYDRTVLMAVDHV